MKRVLALGPAGRVICSEKQDSMTKILFAGVSALALTSAAFANEAAPAPQSRWVDVITVTGQSPVSLDQDTVLIDLARHCGRERVLVDYARLQQIMQADGVVVDRYVLLFDSGQARA